MNKIPRLNLIFWIIQICGVMFAGMGSGVLAKSLHLGVIETALAFAGLALVLATGQLAAKKLHAVLFWAAVLGVTAAAWTLPALLQETMHLGYGKDSALFAAVAAGIFLIWGGVGESFSLDNLGARRAEILFWLAALFSAALGAALACYLEQDSGLGVLISAAIPAVVVLLCGLLWRFTKLPRAVLFWPMFIFIQPLGHAFAEFLARGHDDNHGMGFGPIMTSAMAGYLMAALIIIAARREKQAAAPVEAPK